VFVTSWGEKVVEEFKNESGLGGLLSGVTTYSVPIEYISNFWIKYILNILSNAIGGDTSKSTLS